MIAATVRTVSNVRTLYAGDETLLIDLPEADVRVREFAVITGFSGGGILGEHNHG